MVACLLDEIQKNLHDADSDLQGQLTHDHLIERMPDPVEIPGARRDPRGGGLPLAGMVVVDHRVLPRGDMILVLKEEADHPAGPERASLESCIMIMLIV